MDLKQNKLTRAEWDSIEVPVVESEKNVLNMIIQGYCEPNIKQNDHISMIVFLKTEKTPENEKFLYDTYFEPIISKMWKKYGEHMGTQKKIQKSNQLKKMKSVDLARIQNMESNIIHHKDNLYEFLLLNFTSKLCKYLKDGKSKYSLYLYTLIILKKNSISDVNSYVLDFVDSMIENANSKVDLIDIIEHSYEFIEQNKVLLEYADKELYSHQKDIYSIFRQNKKRPKANLVLYRTPTGTGKTMTPLGLSSDYRIIFVCAARHIGLALAKSAISMNKKIAFAFGCETASDIRLHYFAASDYTRDKRSGGIRKVNNEQGEKVEIIICDVKSYVTAMHYMLAFNGAEQIITYWDEPTIALDYDTHEIHDVIHKNWTNNIIPNMVLSCATLPQEEDIMATIMDFREKFEDVDVHNISTYDFKKSIPIINKTGYAVLPHNSFESYDELAECIDVCMSNKTLLRYFDLREITKFILFMNRSPHLTDNYRIENYWTSIDEITMISMKEYYLEVLRSIQREVWPTIYQTTSKMTLPYFNNGPLSKSQSVDTMKNSNKTNGGGNLMRTQSVFQTNNIVYENTPPSSSGVLATTSDAHTLTDGPTIFLCDDVAKIGKFYIQQTAIPTTVFQDLMNKILKNNRLSEEISRIERLLEDMENKQEKKGSDDVDKKSPEVQKMYKDIDKLREQVKYINIDPVYIPNTSPHQDKWNSRKVNYETAFVPTIEEGFVKEIMALEIENYLKVLLLLGIGLFIENVHPKYLEIMKTMAVQQDLFMIVASTDYIYGTNYSFCHGYLGKDLNNLTNEKTLQCFGRIGRGHIQQNYTIRCRDDPAIFRLFKKQVVKKEASNMSRLFCSEA